MNTFPINDNLFKSCKDLLSKFWEPQETFRNVVTLNINADIQRSKKSALPSGRSSEGIIIKHT